MAICLEGYSSHCSFMERHKALVAACDILGGKTRVSMVWGVGGRGPAGSTHCLTGWRAPTPRKASHTQAMAPKRLLSTISGSSSVMEPLAPPKDRDLVKPLAPQGQESQNPKFRCYHETSKYALLSG